MPRESRGPQLKLYNKPGWHRSVWYIVWTERGRSREHSTGESERGPAEAYFAHWLLSRGEDRPRGPRDPHQRLIADVLAAYARERGAETASPERIGFAIDRLLDYWGELRVDAITPETCKRYRRERQAARDGRAGAKDGTIRKELGVLRAAVNHDQKEGRLTRAPFVWLPSKPPARDRWLTRGEAARLLLQARKTHRSRLHLPLFILIALSTGARKGAILDLEWRQVDLVAGRIDFNPPGRERTSKGRPIIPIPRGLLWFLRAAHRRATTKSVLAYEGARIGDVKKGFAGAARKAKLAGVTPHTLRHTAGTWMAQRGVPLREIAGWLGHTDARTTELYAHHHPDHLTNARRALD